MRCVRLKFMIIGATLLALVDSRTGRRRSDEWPPFKENVSEPDVNEVYTTGPPVTLAESTTTPSPSLYYSPVICTNFKFFSAEETYLPSQIINISSSCTTTNVCPIWNITSQSGEIKILRDDAQLTDHSCVRNMSIQVINFGGEGTTRMHIMVAFSNPWNEPTRVINVQKSDDGENCYQDQDCYNAGQICSAASECSCSSQYVFIRNLRACYPVISRLYGQCSYSEQCRAYDSICQYSACQCPDHHFPDEFFFNCLPEDRGLTEECATDDNCRIRDYNSCCTSGACACKPNYVDVGGVCQRSASSKIYCEWFGILLTVLVMFSTS